MGVDVVRRLVNNRIQDSARGIAFASLPAQHRSNERNFGMVSRLLLRPGYSGKGRDRVALCDRGLRRQQLRRGIVLSPARTMTSIGTAKLTVMSLTSSCRALPDPPHRVP